MTVLDSFLADEAVLYKRVTKKIAQDPLIFAGIKKWDVYDTHEKTDFIERYANLLAEKLVGGPPPAIEFYEKAPRVSEGRVLTSNGNHTMWEELPQRGAVRIAESRIRLNVHPDVMKHKTIEQILGTVAHEMTHERQASIIRDPKFIGEKYSGTISVLFKHNFDHYINGAQDYKAYRNQPIEAHAIEMGELARATIMDFVQHRSRIDNPYEDSGRRFEFQANSMPLDRISTSTTIGRMVNADPHQHYWQGRRTEAKLAHPMRLYQGANADDLVQHYTMAVKCGEFTGYNPEPALEKLLNIAQNHVAVERPGQEPRLVKIPPHAQKMAREALEKLTQGPLTGASFFARMCLDKLNAPEKRSFIKMLDGSPLFKPELYAKDQPVAKLYTGPKPKF